MREIYVRAGSTGSIFLFAWTEAHGVLVPPASVASVVLVATTMDGDAVTESGAMISAGSVPTGYSFGWCFGTEIATSRNLYGDFTVTKTGGGPVKLDRYLIVVGE